MNFVDEILVLVAWADILLVTAGHILIRVVVVIVCSAGIIIIERRIRYGT